MGNVGKSLALALILVMIISSGGGLLKVKPVSAQLIPKPSVPEFSVHYVNSSYYLAPTYTTNPYTGQNQTLSSGDFVKNQTVQFTIKNQQFTPFKDTNGNNVGLYFSVRFKGHYEDNWQYYPNNPAIQGEEQYILASNSEFSVTELPSWEFGSVPSGGLVDFQLQALIGYDYGVNGYAGGYKTVYYYFNGTAGDWSNTQTIAFTDAAFSSSIDNSPYPTISPALMPLPIASSSTPPSSPAVPEFPSLVVLSLLLVILSSAFAINWKMRLKSDGY